MSNGGKMSGKGSEGWGKNFKTYQKMRKIDHIRTESREITPKPFKRNKFRFKDYDEDSE